MFTVGIEGEREVIARMDEMPATVHDALGRTVRRLALLLLSKIQRDKLQGQVLNHRTGKLSRSMEQVVKDEPESIIGRVFSNGTAPYAAIHEFGFHGTEHVRSFTRKQTMVFGRPMNPALTVLVSAFDRTMNMPERSFIRSTFTENAEMIETELTKAVATAAQGETAP